MLQLSRIFELDRLREEIIKNVDFVNTARLETTSEAIDAIGHTPLISMTEADYLIQAAGRNIQGADLVSEQVRLAVISYDTNFGVISTFIDLTSELVTDANIHAFFRRLTQIGANSLCNDLAERRDGAGRLSERKEMRDYHVGIWNFLDLAGDFSDFLAGVTDKVFERSVLRCLFPWFVPDLELFYRTVEKFVEETLFATTAVEQGKEQTSLIWKSADAKFAAVQKLSQRVHQGQRPTRDSAPTGRTAGAPVSMVSEELFRVAGRLSVLDTQRVILADQLNELEVVERVLTRFGGKASISDRRRGRYQERTAAPDRGRRSVRGERQAASPSLSDATLQALRAHPEGATANEILSHLSREFGMTVRPNHLGIALQRHRRAGRLENRDQRWFLSGSREESRESAMIV
jgi:hypothetical protein